MPQVSLNCHLLLANPMNWRRKNVFMVFHDVSSFQPASSVLVLTTILLLVKQFCVTITLIELKKTIVHVNNTKLSFYLSFFRKPSSLWLLLPPGLRQPVQ